MGLLLLAPLSGLGHGRGWMGHPQLQLLSGGGGCPAPLSAGWLAMVQALAGRLWTLVFWPFPASLSQR